MQTQICSSRLLDVATHEIWFWAPLSLQYNSKYVLVTWMRSANWTKEWKIEKERSRRRNEYEVMMMCACACVSHFLIIMYSGSVHRRQPTNCFVRFFLLHLKLFTFIAAHTRFFVRSGHSHQWARPALVKREIGIHFFSGFVRVLTTNIGIYIFRVYIIFVYLIHTSCRLWFTR